MQKIKTRLWNLDKDYPIIKNWWKEANVRELFPHGDSRHYWYVWPCMRL